MKNKNLISISGKAGLGKDEVGKIIQFLISQKNNDIHNFYESWLQSSSNNESGYKIVKFADTLKDIACLLLGCTRKDLEDRDFKDSVLGEEWWQYISFIDSEVKLSYSDGELKNIHKNPEKHGFELQKTTVRQFLQQLGTEALRNNLHENVHINALFGKYKPVLNKWDNKGNNLYPSWIITDTRFQNELQAVKNRGGITVRVKRLCNLIQYTWDRKCPCCNTLDSEKIGQDSSGWQHILSCNECNSMFSVIYGDKMGGGYDTVEILNNNYTPHESETAIDNSVFDYEIDNSGSIEDLIEEVKKILIKEEII